MLDELRDVSKAGVFAVDARQQICFWSPTAVRLTGLSEAEALGRFCYDVIAGHCDGRVWCRKNCSVQRLLRTGKLPSNIHLVTRANGRHGELAVSILAAGTAQNPLAIHFIGALDGPGDYRLTARQHQAVVLLAQGLTGKEIAARMGISPNTVKAMLRVVMAKLRVNTRPGIVGKILRSSSQA